MRPNYDRCHDKGTHGVVPNAGPAASWTDCALEVLCVGETPMPEGSELVVALTLLRVFPRLNSIVFDEGWEEVENTINRSRRIIDRSSKQLSLTTP